jgi:hypothetical protein
MRKNMNTDALNKFLGSYEFESDMKSYAIKEQEKINRHIEFSKSIVFKEILLFIKNSESRILNDSYKSDYPEKIPFTEDNIKSFFSAFSFVCEFSDYDEFEDFSTQVLYLDDFILYLVSGQGTFAYVEYVEGCEFQLNLKDKDLKNLSTSGWSVGKENGLFFAKNDILNKLFYNKYFTIVKRYLHQKSTLNKKTNNPNFSKNIKAMGYSIISENPFLLLHVKSNTRLDNEDSLFILNNINL